MRILFLSNFYPPARPGGYTQWCHEVAERLARRGHAIGVLTSRHERAKAPAGERDILRRLHLEGDLAYYRPFHFFTQWAWQHRENLAVLDEVIGAYSPDLLFVWGMWALSKALPARAEQLLPGRVVYYLSDYWPSAADMHTMYWQSPAQHRLMRLPKRVLGWLALAMLAREGHPAPKFEHAICVSARLRELLAEADVPIRHARVIRGGTDVERFRNPRQRDDRSGQLRLLYAGQWVPHKGVHTAIEAMATLADRRGAGRVHLTLVGSGHPDYEAFLRGLVVKHGLGPRVTFRGPVSRDEMPAVLQEFDVLVFPSTYEEPLGRMTQEAMAAGLAVIGTTTGGTQEILRDGETGLAFAPEDARGLAEQIVRLASDPDLRHRLARTGCQTVLESFTLERMVDDIETYLLGCLAGGARTGIPSRGLAEAGIPANPGLSSSP